MLNVEQSIAFNYINTTINMPEINCLDDFISFCHEHTELNFHGSPVSWIAGGIRLFVLYVVWVVFMGQ